MWYKNTIVSFEWALRLLRGTTSRPRRRWRRGSVQALGGIPPPGPMGRTAEGNLLEPTTGGGGSGDVCEGRRSPSGSCLLIGGCTSQRYCFCLIRHVTPIQSHTPLSDAPVSPTADRKAAGLCVCVWGWGWEGGASPVAPPPESVHFGIKKVCVSVVVASSLPPTLRQLISVKRLIKPFLKNVQISEYKALRRRQ